MPESTGHSPSARQEPDLTGRRLGDYRLIRRLGQGGMAVVYLAEQTSLRRHVAFKVLRSSLAHDETYIARFHHEAQAAAALVHANIVQIYEVGRIDGVHFIAQEYVAGRNLRQLLSRHGPLDVAQAVSILRQVAAALQKAAERGIVHRDIKPENILLTADGEVKVADFGLARVVSGDQRVDLTQVGVTVGTPLYMSPEQLQGRALDSRSDLYSLGVTSYHMLAGRPPFEGETALSLAVQHLQNTPPPLAELRPDLPPALCDAVHQWLAKSPEQRCASTSDLFAALRSLDPSGLVPSWPLDLAGTSLTPVPGAVTHRSTAVTQLQAAMERSTAAQPSRSRRRLAVLPLLAMLIGLIAASAAGAALAWYTRPAPLLRPTAPAATIERRSSAADQYAYARELGTRQAYQAVLKYFPPETNEENQAYADRAKLQLAYLCEDNDPPEALRYYQELALQDRTPQLAAFGLVGLANVAADEGDQALANHHVASLVEHLLRDVDRPTLANLQQLDSWQRRLTPELQDNFRLTLRQTLGPNLPNRPLPTPLRPDR